MIYFTIDELCLSPTATSKHIDNSPSKEIKEHLTDLIENMLDPIRKEYGNAIHVNSGYRCKALNKAVGGASTSSHMYGYAADLKPVKSSDMNILQKKILNWSKTANFDQIILEKVDSKNISRWIHVGIRHGVTGAQRKQILYYNGKLYFPVTEDNWKKFYEV